MDLNINNPEQIKQLIDLLQQLLPSNNDPKKNEEYNEENTAIKTKSIRSDKRKSVKNKFLDMPEINMHKSDSAIDRKLCINPPTPRNRKFVPVEVKCRSCGKTEKVNPAILPESVDRYKCNKCSSSSGA